MCVALFIVSPKVVMSSGPPGTDTHPVYMERGGGGGRRRQHQLHTGRKEIRGIIRDVGTQGRKKRGLGKETERGYYRENCDTMLCTLLYFA